MIIDSHQHFWHYSPEEFPWIDASMHRIQRSFLPEDLAPELTANGIDRAISVQARTSLDETRWLLQLTEKHSFLAGVVGWIPLHKASDKHLEELAAASKLVGVREVMQGRPSGALLDPVFNAGVAHLKNYGLTYDVLITSDQLGDTIEFVDRHPQQVMILDHLAKPKIGAAQMEPWATKIHDLAKRENVFCKVSGMVTEAAANGWQSSDLQPFFDVVLEAFGPSRLLFGSDWPVCLVRCGYSNWCDCVRTMMSALSPTEQSDLFGGSAARAYRLHHL